MQSNYCGTAISNKEQSACDAAYAELYKAQDELSDAIDFLHSRLIPVLSGVNGGKASNPQQDALSVVHGWLVSSTERAQEITERIRSITASLTI